MRIPGQARLQQAAVAFAASGNRQEKQNTPAGPSCKSATSPDRPEARNGGSGDSRGLRKREGKGRRTGTHHSAMPRTSSGLLNMPSPLISACWITTSTCCTYGSRLLSRCAYLSRAVRVCARVSHLYDLQSLAVACSLTSCCVGISPPFICVITLITDTLSISPVPKGSYSW